MRRQELRTYQSVIILKPDLDEPQVDQAIEKITLLIAKSGGTIIKTEKWGKKRLAYRVQKNRFGIYLNIYHTCEPSKVPSLENEYKLYDQLIKHMVVRLDQTELDWAMGKPITDEVAKVKKSDDVDDAVLEEEEVL